MSSLYRSTSARRVVRCWLFVVFFLSLFLITPTLAAGPSIKPPHAAPDARAKKSGGLSKADDAFLEDLEQRSFRYFWEQSDRQTGLVLDRSHSDGTPVDAHHHGVASIAATGFGLTAVCIAAARHWISEEEARERVRVTLRFFAERALQEHGWFYHWMDPSTGARQWNSEVSSIDTAFCDFLLR